MKFQGFVGPSYKLDSVNVDCQRCVNLYVEQVQSGMGKDAVQTYLKSTPGLRKLFEVGNGPIRLVHIDSKGRVFIASGAEMFKASFNGTVWSTTKLGDLETSQGIIKAASMKFSDPDEVEVDDATVFVDGTTNYLFLYTASTDDENFNTFGAFGYPGVPTATHVVWIDGYFIFNKANTGQFYVTDYNSFGVDPLMFAVSEGNSDNIVALIDNTRDLVIINELSTEVFANVGNANFPFERVQGGYIPQGGLAGFAVAEIDGIVTWVGRDKYGQGRVYAVQGLAPKPISTHAVEQAISKYFHPESATAYTYKRNGHSFYVLNFGEATWVYDFATGLWHERAHTANGTLQRHRAEVLAFSSLYDLMICGDHDTNEVYALDENQLSDDGDPITRKRVFPHMSAGGKNLFVSELRIDMETGVGLNDVVQGHDPKAMLKWSKDGGHTWSNEHTTSIGKLGEFKRRVVFRRLGMIKDQVFDFTITDPVKVTLISADVEATEGRF